MNGISLQQLKGMFNLKSDGTFSTSEAKTTGQLYLDKSGKLKNAGIGLFGGSSKSSAAQNFKLRNAIVDMFRSNHATEAFMKEVRTTLGLAENGASDGKLSTDGKSLLSSKPLERRDVKRLLNQFEKARREADKDFEVVVKKNVEDDMAADTDFEIVDKENVKDDMAADTKFAKMGEDFVTNLGSKLKSEKTGFFSSTQVADLQLETIADMVATQMARVKSGETDVATAFVNVLDCTNGMIGLKGVHDHIEPSNQEKLDERNRQFKVIGEALDDFAEALGATGKHPAKTMLDSYCMRQLDAALLRNPLPEKGSDKQKFDSLCKLADAFGRPLFNHMDRTNQLNLMLGKESDPTVILQSCSAWFANQQQATTPLTKLLADDARSDGLTKMLKDEAQRIQEKGMEEIGDQLTNLQVVKNNAERDGDTDKANALDQQLQQVTQRRLELQAAQIALSCFANDFV